MEKNVKPIYLKDYKKPEFSIGSVELLFELFEEYTTVTNIMEITKMMSAPCLISFFCASIKGDS